MQPSSSRTCPRSPVQTLQALASDRKGWAATPLSREDLPGEFIGIFNFAGRAARWACARRCRCGLESRELGRACRVGLPSCMASGSCRVHQKDSIQLEICHVAQPGSLSKERCCLLWSILWSCVPNWRASAKPAKQARSAQRSQCSSLLCNRGSGRISLGYVAQCVLAV